MIEDINGFNNLFMFEDRNLDALKLQMIEKVRVPATLVDIGLKPNGRPYAVIRVSNVAKSKVAKKPEPIEDSSIIQDETIKTE
jgi:hypothetical protein